MSAALSAFDDFDEELELGRLTPAGFWRIADEVRKEYGQSGPALSAALSELFLLATQPRMQAAVLTELHARCGAEEAACHAWVRLRASIWM